jgi:hypothetical protein
MIRKISCLLCILSVFFGPGMLSTVYGQGTATGTILGTVTDSTGAVLPNATVVVTNTATGISHQTQTTASGDYSVPDLQPGPYSVTVNATGFGSQQVSNITLVVAQQARVNFTLKPGAAAETIQVSAGAVALDTDTSAVSQLVSQKQVNQLPLNGRNFLNLLFIGAGAVQTVGEQGQMRQGEGNAISINGARPESNNYTLDGMVNTDTALNTPAVILSQDAIQEFKVQSETYSAEYGFSANQVNIVSKSGGNQFHGSVFEFDRNDAFDASTHFQPVKPRLRQNQFGYVLDGPVWVPKLYDGRNRTFFLANYEGWRIINGTSNYYNVPDPAQVAGNFASSGLPAFGTPACTAALNSNNACMPIDPTTGQPFPGNVIPSSRFSRLANVTAKLFPAPNSTNPLGNYHLNVNLPNDTDQQTYRLDQNLGKLGSVFFRYTKANYGLETASTVSIPAGLNIFNEDSTSWEISHTIPLGHNIINNFRVGYLGATVIQGDSPAPQSDVDALGLTGVFTNLPNYARGYPGISLQNLSGGVGSPGNNPTTSDIPMWEYADSFSLIHGSHSFSMGFDFRTWVQKRDLSTNFLGSYTFNNTTVLQNGNNGTNNCTTPYCGTGNAVADFLLGYYGGASTFQPGPFSPTTGNPGNTNRYHFKYIGPYFQDDWKATPNLTLNLGLRWDFRTIPFEQDNKMFWIDTQNTGGGLCFANQALLTDGIAPAGNGFYRYCGRNNPRDPSYLTFAPRIGFAYRPSIDNKMVVRGGYGIFFDSSETREIDDSGDLYPFVIRTSLSPTTNPNVPKLTNNLFPVTSTLLPVAVGSNNGTTYPAGSQFIAVIISEHPINPYVQQWSLSVERELAPNTTLEINYVGNKGTHLLDRTNINQPYPASDPALCQTNPTAGDCPARARVPYLNFTNTTGTLDSRWDGYSNYNAGNVKLERRTNDLALLAVYTYARSMDDKSAAAGIGATNGFAGHMDDHNPKLDYARSDFDVDHRFVVSYVANLPIGKGKRFLTNANKATDLALGGWQLTGIGTFQRGFPFSVMANDSFGLLEAYNQRANVVGNPNKGFHKSINQWFNTAAFSQPLAGAFGNSGRNILRDPGINNWDMGLLKNFSFGERVNFQLRLESFNTFNHTQWGVDPSSPSAAASGPGTGAVDRNVNDQPPSPNTNFGKITSARPGRILQLGGKITF